jgi:hypothetical protein
MVAFPVAKTVDQVVMSTSVDGQAATADRSDHAYMRRGGLKRVTLD